VHDADSHLHSITSRFIGSATLENFNIAARVNTFYISVLIFAATLCLLAVVLNQFIKKNIITQNELLIFNLTSFCGLVFLFFRVTGAEMYSSLHFIFSAHATLVLVVVSKNLRKQNFPEADLDIPFFSWTVTVAFCLLFFTEKLFSLFGISREFSFTLFLAAVSYALLILSEQFSKNKNNEVLRSKWVDALSSLAWLPLLSVLSEETYMILNQRNIFSFSPGIIFLILCCALAVWKFTAARFSTNRNIQTSIDEILARKYFPVLAAGITAFVLYNPVIPATKEMFETANGVLPIQQFFEFHKIPLADIFSSHVLSDFFTNFIFVFLNGYQNFCFSCYDFLLDVAAVVVIYYALKEITGSGYWAFFAVLFYPYVAHLVPSYVCLSLIPLLALIKTTKLPSIKNYFIFLLSLFTLVSWRMDLGFAGLISAAVTIIFIALQKKNLFFVTQKFLRASLFALIPVAGLFLLFYFLHGGIIFQSIRNAQDYYSSAQSYGNTGLFTGQQRIFYTLYYVFPFIIFLIASYALYIFYSTAETKTQLLCVTTIYLSVYYFANFQRGLVRHGLLEQWDVPLTSFAFLIMMLGLLIYFSDKNAITKFLWITTIMTLLISQYKFPEPDLKSNNLYHEAFLKLKHFPDLNPEKEKINRMPVENNFAQENYADLKTFMDKYLKPGETFADFSNTPMLYYYLHRENPHYFSQSPISYHSEALQRTYIEEIKKSNPKILLFSNYPETWYDNTDGVANTIRHYRIAEYLFRNYRPAFIINHKSIWLRNDLPVQEAISVSDSRYVRDTLSTIPDNTYIRSLAYVWGKYDKQFLNSKHETLQVVLDKRDLFPNEVEKKFYFTPIADKQSGCYVLIRASKKAEGKTEIVMNYGMKEKKSGGFTFTLPDMKMNDYVIRVSSQYNWFAEENNWLTVYPMGGDVTIEKILLLKGD
jgi:hypothetical protein